MTSHTEAREALMEATIPSQAANIPTEAREAVARMLYEDWCDGRRKDDFTFETTPNRNAFFFDADAILARLGELGWVQRDRLLSDDAVEAAGRAMMDVRAASPASDGREWPVLDFDPDFDDLPLDYTQGTDDDPITQLAVLKLAKAALTAAIAKAGEA